MLTRYNLKYLKAACVKMSCSRSRYVFVNILCSTLSLKIVADLQMICIHFLGIDGCTGIRWVESHKTWRVLAQTSLEEIESLLPHIWGKSFRHF